MPYLQPYLEAIVTALVGLGVTLLLALIAKLRVSVQQWLDARTTASEQEVLHLLAKEAYALSERLYIEGGGPEKRKQAIAYITEQLAQKGLILSPVKLEAAIEAAWLDYQTRSRRSEA
ncbi:phage holin [Gorillibacterium sp. CAU 1737]|uniref:phage holin n=1 Tax=Gorillibacterium sp. CAU 1737 TaxID=3140362 RepID=UPI003260D5D8